MVTNEILFAKEMKESSIYKIGLKREYNNAQKRCGETKLLFCHILQFNKGHQKTNVRDGTKKGHNAS